MKVSLARANLSYLVLFSAPSLELLPLSLPMLKALHEGLSQEVRLQANDMSINAGPAISDFRMQVRMPSVSGYVELTASQAEVRFSQLTQEAQIAMARRCIGLADTTIWTNLQKTRPINSWLRLTAWFRAQNGREEAVRFLNEMSQPSPHLRERLKQNILLSFKTIKIDYADKANNWTAAVVLEESQNAEADLFVDCTVNYSNPEFCASIDARLSHFGSTLKDLALSLNLDDTPAESRPS
jgi:hypothetical protein